MLARTFPVKHPRAGSQTHFRGQILTGLKIHTIRLNYDLWLKRAENVNNGNAYVSLRQWKGKPYRSKQFEIARLEKIRIERIDMVHYPDGGIIYQIDWQASGFLLKTIARNDGLSKEDFITWFFKHPVKKIQDVKGAIIHFTDFKYIRSRK